MRDDTQTEKQILSGLETVESGGKFDTSDFSGWHWWKTVWFLFVLRFDHFNEIFTVPFSYKIDKKNSLMDSRAELL